MEFKKIWKYHLLFIIVIVFMSFFSNYVYGGIKGFLRIFKYPLFLNFILFNILYFVLYFFNFYFVCPKTLRRKKVYYFILSVFLLFTIFALTRYFLEEVVLYSFTDHHNYSDNYRNRAGYYFFDNMYFALKPILFSTVLYLFFQYNENKNKMYKLDLDHKKAEMDYLKSQISPHFLFNTLNAFYVELIDDKPETAKDIHKLSELLRFVTYESQEDFIELKNEIKFLEDYIYFYYKRFEDELFIDFNVNGTISNQKIPSLILIHFVENVFKHGIINDKKNPAKISISITDNHLELRTENKFLESEKYTSKGIGKTNIKRRLTALFNSDFDLEYKDKNDYFSAYLKIPV